MSSFDFGDSSDISKLPASAGVGEERLPALAGAGVEWLPASAGVGVEKLPASAGAGVEKLPASAGAGVERLLASAGAGKGYGISEDSCDDEKEDFNFQEGLKPTCHSCQELINKKMGRCLSVLSASGTVTLNV